MEQIRAAMLSPFESAGVHLRLTSLYAETPRNGPIVRNLLYIDARDLSFQPAADGSASAHMQLVAVATLAQDRTLAQVGRSYVLGAKSGQVQEQVEKGAVYTLDVPVMKPGAYQIHAAVRDEATGKIGSASQFLMVPDLKKVRLALASVVLQDVERPPGMPAYGGMTPVKRQFRQGAELEYVCAVERGRKGGPKQDLMACIRLVRDGQEVYAGPAKALVGRAARQ